MWNVVRSDGVLCDERISSNLAAKRCARYNKAWGHEYTYRVERA